MKAGVGKLELSDTPEMLLTEQLSRNDVEVLPVYLSLRFNHREFCDELYVHRKRSEGVVFGRFRRSS